MKLSTYLNDDRIPVTVSLCTKMGTAIVTEESVATLVYDTGVVGLDVGSVQFDTSDVSVEVEVDQYGVSTNTSVEFEEHFTGWLDQPLRLDFVHEVTLSGIEVTVE